MATLTEMVKYDVAGGRALLYVEIPVSRALEGPFLVSGSARPFLWVRKFPNGIVRAHPRKVPWAFLFRGAVEEIARKASEEGWGNVHPPTAEGVEEAFGRLREYEIPEPFEFLYGTGLPEDLLPEKAEEVSWVPKGWALVAPMDRAFLGTTLDMLGDRRALVIHNASRGVSVLRPEPSQEEPDPFEEG